MISKLAISIALLGFLGISGALLFGRSGFALRVGNYFFFYLLFVSIWGLVKNEN